MTNKNDHRLVAEALRAALDVIERKRAMSDEREGPARKEKDALNWAAVHGIEQATASIAARFTEQDPRFDAVDFYRTALGTDKTESHGENRYRIIDTAIEVAQENGTWLWENTQGEGWSGGFASAIDAAKHWSKIYGLPFEVPRLEKIK